MKHLIFLFLALTQCSKEQKEVKILYVKNSPYYSFILETPTTILYSTPYSLELKSNTVENKKKIIFENELKKFEPYNLISEKKEFENVYVSNVLGETNFENNHLFEYDVEINKGGRVKSNIYYPDEMIGSYEFNIDDLTKDMISKALNGIPVKREKNNKKVNNVIILQGKNNTEVFGGNYYINNCPEYSLILALTNKLLLEGMNNKKIVKIEKFSTPTKKYIERIPLPPPFLK